MLAVGVDTGGTFTDFIVKEADGWKVFKISSTPSDPSEAVLAGLSRIAADQPKHIVHGSTVATNALLERKGAKTALITNKGFEDIVEIGRQNRSRLYDLAYRREPQIVPSNFRFGVAGRISFSGEVIEELDPDDIERVVEEVAENEIESVAVCLLFSYLNPLHEMNIKALLGDLNVQVSLSHEILSEFREYERTSTTIINAYVSPKVSKYIANLNASLRAEDSLRIMQSNGGSISAATTMTESVRTILSGPAGGVVGALEIGRLAGHTALITFDMGGTSTDVSLIDNGLSIALESSIAGYPVKVPMIDIHTVGAGGGSIASIDIGGSLKVGPESAGAEPGPICYGNGADITVTDANLYLGRLVPEHFLGGQLQLREELLDEHFDKMSALAGLSKVELAEGILSVTNAAMERAIRVISVERGYDPREFMLFSFGGAGGMHAAFLAKCLDIPKVLVPRNPGILSAMGMLMADVIKDYSLTIMRNHRDADLDYLEKLFLPMEHRAEEELVEEGIEQHSLFLEKYLDMRYQGQSYEIIVPFDGNYVDRFHQLHEQKYGYRSPTKTLEIVNLRLRAKGVPDRPEISRSDSASSEINPQAKLGERKVIFDGEPLRTNIMDREKLLYGNRLSGPALLVEYSSIVVVPPFAEVLVDAYGNLIMEVE